jgi:anti-sigma factor RsiW
MTGTLDNDEQRLLLYMASELPPAQRAELDRRLTDEPQLAAKLEELSSIHAGIERDLKQLDRRSSATVRPDVVARQVGREIRQRLAEPKVEQPTPSFLRRHRMLPWLIPAGIAAAIIVGAFAWIHNEAMNAEIEMAMNKPETQPVDGATAPTPANSEANLALLEESFEITAAEDARIVRADPKKDVAGVDDLSGYLLNVEEAH